MGKHQTFPHGVSAMHELFVLDMLGFCRRDYAFASRYSSSLERVKGIEQVPVPWGLGTIHSNKIVKVSEQ